MSDDRVERILKRLREAGERLTVPRRALAEVLVGASEHLSAEDLAARINASYPAVHRATVYRTLDTFERLGLVEHVHLGHGSAVYHLADEIHQHLVCEQCGSVVEASPRLFAGLERKLRAEHGFAMRYHFAVVGRCQRCAGG